LRGVILLLHLRGVRIVIWNRAEYKVRMSAYINEPLTLRTIRSPHAP
jgi:hypothetical protein